MIFAKKFLKLSLASPSLNHGILNFKLQPTISSRLIAALLLSCCLQDDKDLPPGVRFGDGHGCAMVIHHRLSTRTVIHEKKSFSLLFVVPISSLIEIKTPIYFSRDDIAKVASPFKYAVIGKFSHGRPKIDEI